MNDSKTSERAIRRNLAVLKTRTDELKGLGVENAPAQAMSELKNGKLAAQLKTWVDPILAHRRAMKIKNNLDT